MSSKGNRSGKLHSVFIFSSFFSPSLCPIDFLFVIILCLIHFLFSFSSLSPFSSFSLHFLSPLFSLHYFLFLSSYNLFFIAHKHTICVWCMIIWFFGEPPYFYKTPYSGSTLKINLQVWLFKMPFLVLNNKFFWNVSMKQWYVTFLAWWTPRI